MSQPPSSPATSTAVGALVIPTPTWVASGSHERKRQCRLVEGWTAVSALELGIQSYLNSNPNQIDNLPYPVMAQYDSQRSLLGYLRHNFATRPRPRKSPAPGAPTKPGDSQRPGDGPGPKPSPAAPRRSPWSREQTPDNPFDLIAEFVPHFSDTGLCLRWAGIPSHQSCTLIFQKTCFDAASAQAAGERMADQAEALGDRFLRSAHNPLLRLRPDGLRALFPWNTGWVGEFEFRSPERPGFGCDRCDQKLGHCPPPSSADPPGPLGTGSLRGDRLLGDAGVHAGLRGGPTQVHRLPTAGPNHGEDEADARTLGAKRKEDPALPHGGESSAAGAFFQPRHPGALGSNSGGGAAGAAPGGAGEPALDGQGSGGLSAVGEALLLDVVEGPTGRLELAVMTGDETQWSS